MITKMNEIYRRVAEKHNLSYEFVKESGDVIFEEIKDNMVNYKSGVIKVNFLGSFIIKSVKLENILRRYLQYRKYLYNKDKKNVNIPVSKKVKKLIDVYFRIILPFKKYKEELSQKQIEFCKKIYESYDNKE
jgi:hypothetical protein